MRSGGGLAAYAGPSALGRGAPVSGARVRRVVAVAALPPLTSLSCALAQFHARLFVVRARHRHRYASRALAARAGRTGLPLVRFISPASRGHRLVDVDLLRRSRLALSLLASLRVDRRRRRFLLLLTRLRTDQLQSGHAPRLQRVEVRLLFRRRVFLRGTQEVRARRAMSSRRGAWHRFLGLVANRLPADEINNLNDANMM